MSDVRGFYAELGVDLPAAAGENAAVGCFANPAEHRHDDRSASASVSLTTGAWRCFACGAKGGAYDAALALGRQAADAMALLERCGLADRNGRGSHNGGARVPRAAAMDDAALERAHAALLANPAQLDALRDSRGWTRATVERRRLGFDGERIVIPVADAAGTFVGQLRYLPDGRRRNGHRKMLAGRGTPRELYPPPEAVESGDGWLWFFEGEPDSLAGESVGLPCVALPGVETWDRKSGQWAPRFAGRRVAIMLDCDAPGRRTAQRIAEDLAEHAADVRIVDPAPERDDGYDLSDLLAEAHADGAEALHAAVRALSAAADAAPRVYPPQRHKAPQTDPHEKRDVARGCGALWRGGRRRRNRAADR